ncbi:MAG: response regulator [Rhodospirillales bacterium]|mgnify:CR=1 FL=1|nr:response regulator [Rhodospirillales bacterium]
MTEKSKILVAEDNDFVRMQIVKFLTDASYETAEAASGDVALNFVQDGMDLAIVDVRMEPVDGFEFIRSLRGMGLDIPVILVTGDQNPDLLGEAGKWGVSAVLMKPVQKDRLLKTVDRTLEVRKRRS